MLSLIEGDVPLIINRSSSLLKLVCFFSLLGFGMSPQLKCLFIYRHRILKYAGKNTERMVAQTA